MSSITQYPNNPLIIALLNPATYPHPVSNIRVIETHLSWVILTGDIAYKIKKPIHFPFADFSTLEKRRYYCEQEVKLNQVSSPGMYKGVLPLYGTLTAPSFTLANQPVIEYVIQMHEFPQTALLLPTLSRSNLTERLHLMCTLATYLATFHETCPRAPVDSPYGNPTETVYQAIRDNTAQIHQMTHNQDITHLNNRIVAWNEAQFLQLKPLLSLRKSKLCIRQCHGDLQLGNIVCLHSGVYCFDRIEFNPSFAWIDPINDLAFLLMDLECHSLKTLSYTLLNAYLDKRSDYEGLPLLNFYKAYRAMVRAKVALLNTIPQLNEMGRYIDYTIQLIKPKTPKLILSYGLSGSGKSHCSKLLAPYFDAIILRSDIYRHDSRFNFSKHDLYTEDSIHIVYQGLLELTATLLHQGQSIWVDASFLKQRHRCQFITLAKKHGFSWAIVQTQAPYDALLGRINARLDSKVTSEILATQFTSQEALNTEEISRTLCIDDCSEATSETLADKLKEILSS